MMTTGREGVLVEGGRLMHHACAVSEGERIVEHHVAPSQPNKGDYNTDAGYERGMKANCACKACGELVDGIA